MSVRGAPAPELYLPEAYWEDRARRFAAEGEGLAAVCSYGMPDLYNRLIDRCQKLALDPWLEIGASSRVLDVGCGVGRWSTRLAARGAHVTGVDLSPTMIAEATRRATATGIADRCHFRVQDLAHLEVDGVFDVVLGVTVLQHILDLDSVRGAIQRMAQHLAPGGRMVLLEAAPESFANRCDSTVFRARPRASYRELFRQAELDVVAITGVDPAPFKPWLLPRLPALPRSIALPALYAATFASAPIDLLFGRRAVERSWHAVFVLTRKAGEVHAR